MYDRIMTMSNLNRLIEKFDTGPIPGLCEDDHILIYNYMIELKNRRENQISEPKPTDITTITINKGVVTDFNSDVDLNAKTTFIDELGSNNDIDLEDVPNLLYLDPAAFDNISPNRQRIKRKFFRFDGFKKSKCV